MKFGVFGRPSLAKWKTTCRHNFKTKPNPASGLPNPVRLQACRIHLQEARRYQSRRPNVRRKYHRVQPIKHHRRKSCSKCQTHPRSEARNRGSWKQSARNHRTHTHVDFSDKCPLLVRKPRKVGPRSYTSEPLIAQTRCRPEPAPLGREADQFPSSVTYPRLT